MYVHLTRMLIIKNHETYLFFPVPSINKLIINKMTFQATSERVQ